MYSVKAARRQISIGASAFWAFCQSLTKWKDSFKLGWVWEGGVEPFNKWHLLTCLTVAPYVLLGHDRIIWASLTFRSRLWQEMIRPVISASDHSDPPSADASTLLPLVILNKCHFWHFIKFREAGLWMQLFLVSPANLASPSSYPCRSVGQSVGDVFRSDAIASSRLATLLLLRPNY